MNNKSLEHDQKLRLSGPKKALLATVALTGAFGGVASTVFENDTSRLEPTEIAELSNEVSQNNQEAVTGEQPREVEVRSDNNSQEVAGLSPVNESGLEGESTARHPVNEVIVESANSPEHSAQPESPEHASAPIAEDNTPASPDLDEEIIPKEPEDLTGYYLDPPVKPYDTDGDGVPDVLGKDFNNDGTPDVTGYIEPTYKDKEEEMSSPEITQEPQEFDTNGDGTPDTIGVDYDNDGTPDQGGPIQPEGIAQGTQDFDTDGNGITDARGIDNDGDGILDKGGPIEENVYRNPDVQEFDTNGDGLTDTAGIDTDGDGQPDKGGPIDIVRTNVGDVIDDIGNGVVYNDDGIRLDENGVPVK